MSPLAAPATDDLAEIAELVVTWSGVVLGGFALLMAILTVLFVGAGFFGIRELRSIRRTGADARRELEQQKTVAQTVKSDTDRAMKAANDLSEEATSLLDRARTAVDLTETQTEQVRQLSARLQTQIQDLDQRMNTMVEVSYLFNQGEEAYHEGQYDKAVEFLHRALQLQPKNARVRYRLGRALTNLGRDEEALTQLTTAMADGHDPAHGERGLAWLFRHSDPARADEHAERALAAAPRSAANWNCAGLLRRDQEDYPRARKAHQKARDLEPNTITTPFYLALLDAQAGRLPRAQQWSEEAVTALDVESRARIFNIWAVVIRWSDLVLRDRLDEADRYAGELAETCPSRRRAVEVGTHMRFLLRALDHTDLEERYLHALERKWGRRR
jgi:tetratricopeptide (TPR) repeat protein